MPDFGNALDPDQWSQWTANSGPWSRGEAPDVRAAYDNMLREQARQADQ